MNMHDQITLTIALVGVLGFLYGLQGKGTIVGMHRRSSYAWNGFQLAILCTAALCVDGLYRVWS